MPAGGQGPAAVLRRRQRRARRSSSSRPIKGPSLEQITVEVGSGIAQRAGGRQALRRGRQEAGPAARPPGLVGRRRQIVTRRPAPTRAAPTPGRRDLRHVHRPTGSSGSASGAGAEAVAAPSAPGAYPFWFYLPACAVIYRRSSWSRRSRRSTSASRAGRCSTRRSSASTTSSSSSTSRRSSAACGNTLIYAVVTSGPKVVLGMLLAVLLTSQIIGRGYLRSVVFFPVLVSTIGVGLTFTVLMNPTTGVINDVARRGRHPGPGLADRPALALLSVALVDVWKGVGLATVIYIAGIVSIPQEYYEAARVDGAGVVAARSATSPCRWPGRRRSTVIILSLIGGLRSFDLIWAMTRGGPGFTSDVIASVIYKQYQAGFYGLSTAGNVVLFLLVTAIILPLSWFLNRREVRAVRTRRPATGIGGSSIAGHRRGLPRAVRVHRVTTAAKDPGRGRAARLLLPDNWVLFDNIKRGREGARLHADHGLHQQHDPDGRERGDHGRARRDGRLRAAAADRPLDTDRQRAGAGRPDHPAGRRADDLGAAEAAACSRRCTA